MLLYRPDIVLAIIQWERENKISRLNERDRTIKEKDLLFCSKVCINLKVFFRKKDVSRCLYGCSI